MTEQSVLQDAARIWSFLDDLAESDPSGYRKFIEEQIASCNKHLEPPISKFVIRATIKGTRKPLYVHFCSWNIVPEPKSENTSVTVKCGEKFDIEGGYAIAMAFNPQVFVQHKFTDIDNPWACTSGFDCSPEEDKRYQLVWLGLHYLEQEKHIVTEESNSLICSSVPLKPRLLEPEPCHGSREQIYKSIGFLKRLFKQPRVKEVGEVEQMCPNTDNMFSLVTESHLHRPFSEANDDKQYETRTVPVIPPSHIAKSRTPKKTLIEEVPDVCKVCRISWNAQVLSQPKQSSLSTDSSKRPPNHLKLTFDLPGVESGSQCDLDITTDKLSLQVQDKSNKFEPLELELPCRIDVESTVAKFNPKKGKLVVLATIAGNVNK